MNQYRHIAVVGTGVSGQATACFLLEHAKAVGLQTLTLVDSAQTEALSAFAANLATENPSATKIITHFSATQVPPRTDKEATCKSFSSTKVEPGEAEECGATLASTPEARGQYDLCIITPGLPPHTVLSRSAYEHSREVISEVEFAYRFSPPGLTWVAITGTNGKTTTTELVRSVLAEPHNTQRKVYSVGNIGTPALELLDQVQTGDIFVAEVSSFQAARLTSFKPQVAALLNLSADHLDWHEGIARYAADKCEIFAKSADGDLVLAPAMNQLHPEARPVVMTALKAARDRGAQVQVIQADEALLPLPVEEMQIRGKHNLVNACFATEIAHYFGVPRDDVARALRDFAPQPHRMQEVGRFNDVLYVNDSKATNPDSAIQALGAYAGLELIVLLGGKNKGADYHDLAKVALERANTILLFGEAEDELLNIIEKTHVEGVRPAVTTCGSMRDAVKTACRIAKPQQVVLLSPANASFDEFQNYADRGETFTRVVNECAG